MSAIEIFKASSWKAWEGRVIEGKFPLRQWLGGSDHSAVFLTEASPQQRAAIKLVSAEAGDNLLLRWRAAAQLSHPHLIRIFEVGRFQIDGMSFFYALMENADDDLAQILPERALAPEEAKELLPPLLDALSYLHGKGFVHGRIQPSNVLAVGEQLKLSSDTIVSPAEVQPGHRRRDLYDAPETAAGIITPAGDLWSLGVTLVAALTQNVAFVGEAEQGGPKLPPAIPEPFRGIARECLHLDPRRRCSIAEIIARLQPTGRSVPAPAEPPAKKRAAGHYKITWRILIPIAVLLAWGLLYKFHNFFSPAATPNGNPDIKFVVTEPPKSATPAASATTNTPPAAPAAPAKTSVNSPGDVLHQVLPDVSQSARNTITGTIKVGIRVEVDSSGKVSNAKLEHAGPSKYFARLALQAAQRWQFTPAEKEGQPAASVWLLHFRFRRTSTQVIPERGKVSVAAASR